MKTYICYECKTPCTVKASDKDLKNWKNHCSFQKLKQVSEKDYNKQLKDNLK